MLLLPALFAASRRYSWCIIGWVGEIAASEVHSKAWQFYYQLIYRIQTVGSMNGRRSLDPASTKPVSINIYYNINSKNITNSNEVQSHPVTARAHRHAPDDPPRPDSRPKIPKAKKKKYSFDATNADRKNQRLYKKSNNNSLSSGFGSVCNPKKQNIRKNTPAASSETHEGRLGQLLQIFSEGKIDKNKLTRQIINIFQHPFKNNENLKDKKSQKNKKSQSTFTGTVTPKNMQPSKYNEINTNNLRALLNVHGNRKKHSKSEKSNYENISHTLVKKQIMNNFIECKAINSSLFLSNEQEKTATKLIVDRTHDVQTSYSIILLNENLRKERQHAQSPHQLEKRQTMAIKIQRAWRRTKTNKLIASVFQRNELIPTDINQGISDAECVTELPVGLEGFLSEEMNRKSTLKQNEAARVESLKHQELDRWEQMMSFIKVSMHQNSQSSSETLQKIIKYFQDAKKVVENELKIENNKFQAIENRKQLAQEANLNEEQAIVQDSIDDSSSQKSEGLEQQQQTQFNHQLYFQTLKSQNLSLDAIHQALCTYSKKVELNYERRLSNLNKQARNYLQTKIKIEKQFKQSRGQIRRIIENLKRGYNEAKSILERQILLSEEDSSRCIKSDGSRDTLQKCKSDNYLLKTAINYRNFIEAKQKEQIKKKLRLQGSEKKLSKGSKANNLENKSQDDSDLVEISVEDNTPYKLNDCLNRETGSRSCLEDTEAGQGQISNNFNRFEDKIFSQEFLKFRAAGKAPDEDDEDSLLKEMQYQNNAQQISLFENTQLNNNNKRLKSLTSEQKDDIFEFIFIDLTLQLITEEKQSSKIYASVQKHIQKRKRIQSIPKGVKTNLQSSRNYLQTLQKEILAQFVGVYFKHILVPMGPTAKQMLKYMHEQGNQSEQYVDDQANVPLILPVEVFDSLENKNTAEYPRLFDDESKEAARVRYLRNLDKIHHKALFDSLNESLDMERPFGLWGTPFPWKTSYKNCRAKEWDDQLKKRKLRNGVEKVARNCSFMCGLLVDKEDSLVPMNRISSEYLEQIREDRMSKMLETEMVENEDRWSFFDDETTEMLVELSRYLMVVLVEEMIHELTLLGKKSVAKL